MRIIIGIIRLLLALSVVSAHISGSPLISFVGGETAVRIFFVISGFYMQMIIGEYSTKYKFWLSRYIRIFPTYIVCAIASLYFVRGAGYIAALNQLPTGAEKFFN